MVQEGDSLRGMWNERQEIVGGIVRGDELEFWTDTLGRARERLPRGDARPAKR